MWKTKVAYMALGALIASVGYFIGTFNLQTTQAQRNTEEVIDEIVARKIIVVNNAGNPFVIMDAAADSDRGGVSLINAAGEKVVAMEVFRNGAGGFVLNTKEGKRAFWVSSSGGGSGLSMFNEEDTITVSITGNDLEGGRIRTYNDAGKILTAIGAGEDGNGVVKTYNKVGFQKVTGRLPR